MPAEVILPRVDMDMTTGKISKWFVADGAAVTKGQPLFEIETDKAAMEIEAPSSGTIRDLADPSGRDIPVGSVVAWIDAEGDPPAPARPAAPAVRPDAGTSPVSSPGAGPDGPSRAAATRPDPVEPDADPRRPRATPMARRLAIEHGLDLGAVRGSGPRGRIQADDVLRDARAAEAALAPMVPDADPLPRPAPVEPRHVVPDGAARATAPAAVDLVRLREGRGAPLLLLHGFGADAGGWRPFLSGRSLDRPVYALDLPGHGAAPLGAVASFDALVEAVEAALVGADLPALDLVGHSLGGGVAAALAARGALDLRSLLLLAPAGLGPEINGAFLRGFLAAGSETSLAPWLRELTVDPDAVTPAFVRATLKAREAPDALAGQRRLADALFPDGTQAFSVRDDLARLAVPVRVVVGAADRVIPARQAGGLPGSVALHLFPGVGHMPHVEVGDAVAAIVGQMARP